MFGACVVQDTNEHSFFFSPEDSSGMKWVTLFFSYKNKLYKNNEVETGEIIRTN